MQLFLNSYYGVLFKKIEGKYETLDELEQGSITYLMVAFDKMFNMSNVVITSLHDFIKNFSKDGIAKVPNENISSLNQQMNSVCECLAESNSFADSETKYFRLEPYDHCVDDEYIISCE